jgi:hypothetical protein
VPNAEQLVWHTSESLLAIRDKWRRGELLSERELAVVGYYIHQGCEGPAGRRHDFLPSTESYIGLLEAFAAALPLGDVQPDHLHYFFGHLDSNEPPNYGPLSSTSLVKVAHFWINKLKSATEIPVTDRTHPRGHMVLIGRNLEVLFRDCRFTDAKQLNAVLQPHLPTLFRVAIRGHYLQEKRPLRPDHTPGDSAQRSHLPLIPSVATTHNHLSITLDDNRDFSFALTLHPRRVVYPLYSYPVIREFAAMLKAHMMPLPQGDFWNGPDFFAFASDSDPFAAFNFRQRNIGIQISFTAEEWRELGELMEKALALPEMQPLLQESVLAYGEV